MTYSLDDRFEVQIARRDIYEFMRTSSSQEVSQLFAKNGTALMLSFMQEAVVFMDKLREIAINANTFFVRCVKPNHFQRADTVDGEFISSQLAYMNMPE